jgi:hypothetical protein
MIYSITSSAVASRVGGTVRPSALAVLRLITSWNFSLNHQFLGSLGVRRDQPRRSRAGGASRPLKGLSRKIARRFCGRSFIPGDFVIAG